MSRTIPTEFTGTPTLTAEKVATIRAWYESALADSDVADDPADGDLYATQRMAFEAVLRVLFDMPLPDDAADAQAPALVSWGRAQGSTTVVSTRAHQYDPDTVASRRRTLCGVRIPTGCLPGERARTSMFESVFTDSPADTAALPRCQRCVRMQPDDPAATVGR